MPVLSLPLPLRHAVERLLSAFRSKESGGGGKVQEEVGGGAVQVSADALVLVVDFAR